MIRTLEDLNRIGQVGRASSRAVIQSLFKERLARTLAHRKVASSEQGDLVVLLFGPTQHVGNLPLDRLRHSVVRGQIEQRRSGRIDAVQDELIARAFGQDQKLAVSEGGAVSCVGG